MDTLITFMVNEERCKQAILEFENENNTMVWLIEHARLFQDITYRHQNIPKLVNCYYMGIFYSEILKFFNLYTKISNCIKPPF